MKKTNFILVFALLIAFAGCKKDVGLTDDDKTKFLKSYGTLSKGADIKQTSDGGYIMVGTIQGAGSIDIYLKKVDEYGNDQWSNTFDGPLGVDDEAVAIEILDDGSYAILGTTEGNKTVSGITYSNIRSTYLLVADYNGKQIPGKSLVLNSLEKDSTTSITINHEVGKNLVITPLGNYLAASEKEIIKFNTPYKVVIIRLVEAASFKVIDSIQIDFSPKEVTKSGVDISISDLFINSNLDIVFTGFKDEPISGARGNRLLFGLNIINLDTSGNGKGNFNMSYGNPGGAGNSIFENTSGEILIAGFNSDGGNKQLQVYNFANYYVLSPVPTWEFKGSNSTAFEEEAVDIVEVSDGYLLAGFSESNGDRQYYVVKIDKLGNSIIWEKKYGYIRFDEAKGIVSTSDNGMAVIGTSSDERGNTVMTFLKLDANGNLTE